MPPAVNFGNGAVYVTAPGLVEEVVPVRECCPMQYGQRINDASELALDGILSRWLYETRMRHPSVHRPLHLSIGLRSSTPNVDDVPGDATVSIDTFVQLLRLQSFCVIANVHHA